MFNTCDSWPMAIFISSLWYFWQFVTRVQTSLLIIKFGLLLKNQINFVIHKYLEESDWTEKSCKRNIHIKTYLFSSDTLFRGYFPIRTFITFPFDFSFFFIYLFFCICWHVYWIRLTFCLIFYDFLFCVRFNFFIRGGKLSIYTYFLWITFQLKSIFAFISISTFYILIHLFSAIECYVTIKISILTNV